MVQNQQICEWIIKKGMSKEHQKKCTLIVLDNERFCKKHLQPSKKSPCRYVLTMGKNKGKPCSFTPHNGERCARHSKVSSNPRVHSGQWVPVIPNDWDGNCIYETTRGPNSGNKCKTTPHLGALCSQHYRLSNLKEYSTALKMKKKNKRFTSSSSSSS